VGPKVTRTITNEDGSETLIHRPIGGQSRVMATVEYTIPVIERIRLAAFYETGNLWEDPYEVDLGNLASTAGVGLRLDLPGFPVRIDRAWVIESDDELSETETWVFWIGYDN
jgi:outer membrane protein assembly factor BamA